MYYILETDNKKNSITIKKKKPLCSRRVAYPPKFMGQSSCAQDPSGPCPLYLFIWWFICIL